MPGSGRINHAGLARKVVPADAAAAMIKPGATVGMSGFTGAGYPKEVPLALAKRITEANASGERFRINVWTGASTAPELDGALAAADGIELRLPYQSDPISREKINSGHMEYIDVHLSHVAQMVWMGFLGHLDVALVEVSGITADGALVPSSSVGNNKTWIDQADSVILEVNSWQSSDLEGMHDIYYGTALPPNRRPIPPGGDASPPPAPRPPPERAAAPAGAPRRPDGGAVPAVPRGQGRRRGGDRRSRPQHRVHPTRRGLTADRRASHRVPRARGRSWPAARRAAPDPVRG